MKPLIHLDCDKLYYSTREIANLGHVVVPRGVTVVIGPNGSGKSMLADIIERGRNFRTNRITFDGIDRPVVRKVEFADIHSLRGITAAGYYQQRYEATMNDEVPTVAEALGPSYNIADVRANCELLDLHDVTEKRINYLSSGELRKLLIATALTARPDLLILDNPYIGLDVDSRRVLDTALQRLAESGISIILIVCDPTDVPSFTTAVIPVIDMTIKPVIEATMPVKELRESLMYLFDYAIDTAVIPRPLRPDNEPVDTIASFDNCVISYGQRVIRENLNWTIRDNERWALNGPNGSGKSTLLSMINADNPARYRSNITLFEHHRGAGHSIWDIKRRIGYVSPEMRLYFTATGSAVTVIGQGLIDTVGSYVRLRPDEHAQAEMWVQLLHLESIAERPYNTLSAGERQMVLLARAMIKQPRLLILDEPMHGLDYGRKRAMRALINHFAARADQPQSPYPMSLIYVTHHAEELPECINKFMSL